MTSAKHIIRNLLYSSIFALMALSSMHPLHGQSSPIARWDFRENDWPAASNKRDLRMSGQIREYERMEERNKVFIRLKHEAESGTLVLLPSFEGPATLELDFRIQQDQRQATAYLFYLQDRSLDIRLSPAELIVWTKIRHNSEIVQHKAVFPLTGSGIASYSHWTDGEWHNLKILIDTGNGRREIRMDGQTTELWAGQTAPAGPICGGPTCGLALKFGNEASRGNSFRGDIGAIQVYRSVSFVPQPAPRNLGNSQATASDQHHGPDPREFPARQPIPRASAQLASFPAPRYRPGHGLLPNYNWINPYYFSGYRLNTQSLEEAGAEMIRIQSELAGVWNYYLTFGATTDGKELFTAGEGATFPMRLIRLANEHPEWPVAITSAWAHVNPSTVNSGTDKNPNISRKDLGDQFYLQNDRRQFLDGFGKISPEPVMPRPNIPLEYWREDGEALLKYMNPIISRLSRPVNMINENGEVPPYPLAPDVMELDPVFRKLKVQSGQADWTAFASEWKTACRSSYRDGFLTNRALRNTLFTWYAIDAGPYELNRFSWDIARKAMTPIHGQYYSTPNFYVRWPENWEKWRGPWHGWEWISICRKEEILTGDALFSPFVGAGWDRDPEKNVRPSQWLGLLKCLGVVGAEFYYTGVFHERNLDNFPRPENYAWQAVMPSYAQAVTSRYEEILRNGALMTDPAGQPMTEFKTNDPRILLVARKHRTQEEYIIAGTIQPVSNAKGNVPDETIANVSIDGRALNIPVRRQGSVYHLDLSLPGRPVVRQLDGWHEAGHPSWWTKDIRMEAEMADFLQDCRMVTEDFDGQDLSRFTTFVVAEGISPCAKFTFQPRESSSYQLSIRVAALQGSVKVIIDGKDAGTYPVRTQGNWSWIDIDHRHLQNLSPDSHTLSLLLSGSDTRLDQLTLRHL